MEVLNHSAERLVGKDQDIESHRTYGGENSNGKQSNLVGRAPAGARWPFWPALARLITSDPYSRFVDGFVEVQELWKADDCIVRDRPDPLEREPRR